MESIRMLSMTQITLVLVVFGSLTHGSLSCDNIRRITKDTCLRVADHLNKRNTNFLDYGYKIKFQKANNHHDSYVELTHKDFHGMNLKVHNPHAEQIFSNNQNEVNNYEESIQNGILTKDMYLKNQFSIRSKRDSQIRVTYCCQLPKSPPCEIYSCHR